MKKANIEKKPKPAPLCARIRAVWDHDKESRAQDFLNGASRLFTVKEFAAISVSDICKAADLAKGTFYLYFKTKEDAFLALTRQQIDLWSEAIEEKLVELDVHPPAEKVAAILAQSFGAAPALPRLMQMLHSILERNATDEAVFAFKSHIAGNLDRQAAVFGRMYPELTSDQIQLFMTFCQIILTGTWQYANPPANVRAVLESKGLDRFLFAFEPAVVLQVVTFLHGLGIK